MVSKVQCLFWSDNCTPEGRGGEKGGSANFQTKHTEPLTPEIPSALYCTHHPNSEMDYSYLNSTGGPSAAAACSFDSMSAAAAAAAAADSFVYGDMGNPYRCYPSR